MSTSAHRYMILLPYNHVDNPTELYSQHHEDDKRFWKGSSQRRYERLIAPTGTVVDNSDYLMTTPSVDNGTFDFHTDTQGSLGAGDTAGQGPRDTSARSNFRKKLDNACNSKHPDDRHNELTPHKIPPGACLASSSIMEGILPISSIADFFSVYTSIQYPYLQRIKYVLTGSARLRKKSYM